jgi:hypothetical protein
MRIRLLPFSDKNVQRTQTIWLKKDPHPDSRSVRLRYGSEDPHPHPDPYQNVTDPEHSDT